MKMISFLIRIAFICTIVFLVPAETTVLQQATNTKNANEKDYTIIANRNQEESSNGRCHDSDWIPYRDEKCFKLLDIAYETQILAKDTCKSLSAPGSFLASIHSHEEGAFLQELFIQSSNKQASNFWIGLERISNSSDFVWPNGLILSAEMHSNWAPGHPSQDWNKKCVKLEFDSNNNFKLEIKNQFSNGLWYNVPCANLNLVICESRQQPTLYDIQFDLKVAELEIKYLREVMEKFYWEIEEQKYESIENNEKIVAMNTDINSNTQELKNQGKQLVIISKDVENTAKNLEQKDKQFLDVIGLIKRNIQRLDEKDKQSASMKDNIEQLSKELSKKEQQLKTVEGIVAEHMQRLEDRDKEIDDLNKKIMKSNNKLEENDKQISALKSQVLNSKNKFEEKENEINILNETVKQNTGKLDDQDAKIKLLHTKVLTVNNELSQTNTTVRVLNIKVYRNTVKVRDIEEMAVTDIRFGNPQVAQTSRGPGFNEMEGYVITGVVNEDRDAHGIIDKVYRRRLEIHRNGHWSTIKFH